MAALPHRPHIPATAGFGVTYEGLHATDERIRLDAIPTVQATYHTAILNLLGVGAHLDQLGRTTPATVLARPHRVFLPI